MKVSNWYVFPLLCALVIGGLASVATGQSLRSRPFSMGIYIYESQMSTVAAEQGKDYWTFFEEHLQSLQTHGVNAIHLGGTTQGRFAEHLRLAKKCNMKLLPQLDFAYFNPSWTDPQMNASAQTVGNFINQYNDPAVMAWSVKEEVAAGDVGRLSQYYTNILQYAPDAKFAIVHNNLKAAQTQPLPNPAVLGTDRYAFWWEVSGGGYLASPSFALDWTRSQASYYYKEAAQRNADFMLVTTQGGILQPAWANRVANNTADPAMMAKVRQWAADGRMGWKIYNTPQYGERFNVWKWYRTPANCTKALAWTAVLEGAKDFFNWHYNPQLCDTDIERSATQESPSEIVFWNTLAGRPGMDNPQMQEFCEASREIRQYERIITNMTKLDDSPVSTKESSTYCNAFSFPGLNGKVVVVQNSNVGTWPANSKHFFDENDPIYIDDEGNLEGYVPATGAMGVNIAFDNPGESTGVYDIATGEQIIGAGPPGGQAYETQILPGSGKLLFLGSAEESQILHKMMGTFPAVTPGVIDNGSPATSLAGETFPSVVSPDERTVVSAPSVAPLRYEFDLKPGGGFTVNVKGR